VILVSAPYRISFIGGGTDTPESCEYHQGRVISVTINKYIHVLVTKKSLEDNYRVSYKYDVEEPACIAEIKHNIIRDCLNDFSNHDDFLEVVTVGDVPGRGTGLGSSSALAVAILSALKSMYSLHRLNVPETAFEVERAYSKLGRQDQYASFFGGFREYTFSKDGAVWHSEELSDSWLFRFQNEMILRYIGVPSDSTKDILDDQSNSDLKGNSIVMSGLASKFVSCVRGDLTDYAYLACLDLIDESWDIKRRYSDKVCTNEVSDCIEDMRSLGCKGLKVLGSGGGGFVMGFHNCKEIVKRELGGKYLDVRLTGKLTEHCTV